MALVDVIGSVVGAVFDEIYYQDNVYEALAEDYTSQLEFGDTIEIPTDTTERTVNEQNPAQARSQQLNQYQWSNPDLANSTKVDLVIQHYDDVNILVPYTAQRQVRPDLLESNTRHAARVIRERVNTDLRTTLDGVDGDSLFPNTVSYTHLTLPTKRIV